MFAADQGDTSEVKNRYELQGLIELVAFAREHIMLSKYNLACICYDTALEKIERYIKANRRNKKLHEFWREVYRDLSEEMELTKDVIDELSQQAPIYAKKAPDFEIVTVKQTQQQFIDPDIWTPPPARNKPRSVPTKPILVQKKPVAVAPKPSKQSPSPPNVEPFPSNNAVPQRKKTKPEVPKFVSNNKAPTPPAMQPLLGPKNAAPLPANQAAQPAADNGKPKFAPNCAADSELVEMIEKDILESQCNVKWQDIAGLTQAKKLLEEAVVLPMLMPTFFTGIRSPWKGILLFGPPGTGKTMLAKALATECETTFFNVSLASLTSKWRGESEKLVRLTFEMARFYAPSIIFIDEIDAIGGQRGGNSEHEASRRVKTEFLVQMDGINSSFQGADSGEKKIVLVLGATNNPWDLDDALRRRLEKRVYIPLPDAETRKELFKVCIKDIPLEEDVNNEKLAEITEGYSGADIRIVCRDASLMRLREKIDKGEIKMSELKEAKEQKSDLIAQIPVRQDDFVNALKKVNSSVNAEQLERYAKWMSDFGSI